MLAPDSRSLLIDQLSPPPGCHFDAAVATTFTLDLTATLLPALAFAGFHLAGGTSDPIATLESIRSTASRIDVFCQAGQIAVPEKAPDLLAFLEPMIRPVARPKGGLFHPKVWFIRYVDEAGQPSFRLLVLTRNLTMDASWDLAVRLDSERMERTRQPKSAALRDLLRSLPANTTKPIPSDRRERIEALAEEAGRIVWQRPGGVDDLLLHLLDAGRKPTMDLVGSRHLVVSPFIDAAGLSTVRATGPIEVLGRAEELEKLDPSVIERLKVRVLDDLAVVEAAEGSRLGGQLHAKMYVVEQSRNYSKTHVFIGSANATGPAFINNTEFMVELRGKKSQFGIDQFLGDNGDFVALTEPYSPTGNASPEPDDLAQIDLDNAARRIGSLAYTIEVLKHPPAAGKHQLRMQSDRDFSLDTGWHATIGPLTLPDYAHPVQPGKRLDALVPDVATADITPFLAIRIESPAGGSVSTVVVAELKNDPDDRLDVVLARQIDSPDKFLRFVFFLLSLGNPEALAALATTSSASDGNGPSSPFGAGGSGVLEMVLGALATRPSALSDLDTLVRRLEATTDGRTSLPEGFLEFWSVVREAAGFVAQEPA